MAKPLHEPGLIVDGFRLEEIAHRGGMAALWRVSRPGTTTPLLMKVPRIGEGADPAAIVSFEMEQMILPRLTGLHVPKFIAAGDFAVQPYIVMEAIPGPTLLPRLTELPLPYAEVADIGVKIAQALDDLHRQHVVHLDVKPSNIMFRPTGEAVLLDFGLSHHERLPDLMQEEFRLPFGTAPYMSPEQLRGIRNDPRSDLFALGVLLYFFSTGVRPFGESETLRGMRRRLWRDPVPPRQLRPDYPPWLQEVVLRCLEIEPAWRYPTAAQLAFDLEPSKPGQADQAVRTSAARSVHHGAAPAVQSGHGAAAQQVGAGRPAFVRADRCRRHRSCGGVRGAQRCAARHGRAHSRDAALRAACLRQRAQAGPDHDRLHARRARPQ